MSMVANAHRPPLQVLTVRGEQVTAVPMSRAELAGEDLGYLGLPDDYTGLQPLKGWNVYDHQGDHFGRVYARSTVMVAEWLDTFVQGDYVLAKWGCRRLARAIAEILIIRDDVVGPIVSANHARAAQWATEAAAENARYQQERRAALRAA
ncbi:hypothetical protein [Streptomyces sp. RKAG293]|uniref:hypothetical protein n=1 Tax=Streptomyces sp. RKAG293 TaxID=2893403 RepID=UPI0020344FA6|nr:hypothetical protein [Streptomyces sp. RKAG293]MCM2424147.1 hypothetical protein [Streptomyces sp. RKAG293]